MVKNKTAQESTSISELVVFGIQEKKGNEIVRLDLRNIHSSVADYFVVCHAESTTQVKAIAQSVEDEVFKALEARALEKGRFTAV
jgi:ribosome-associated protein